MGSKYIESASEAAILGLIRSEEKENARNIEDRISLARRTGYSLMKSGFQGSNDVGPKVSYKIDLPAINLTQTPLQHGGIKSE